MTRTPLAALLLAGSALPLLAQGIGDSTVTATISQRFEADSNYDLDEDSPGTSYFTDTGLALGLVQETQTQRFVLGFDTGLRALWRAEEDFEFTFADPSAANLGYRQDWASGSMNVDLRYRQRRTDFLDDITFDDVIDGEAVPIPDDLTGREQDTTERRYDANFSLALATDSPSSYRIGLRAARIDYSDTSEDLAERDDLRGDVLWTLRLNPVLSSAVNASYAYIDTDNLTEDTLRVAEIDAGVIYDPAPDFSVNLGLGYANRERRETIGGVRQTTEDESGPVLRAGLTYQVADDISVAGNLRVSEAAPDTRVSGDLRASYALPRGALTAQLAQDFTADSDGDEVRVSRAGIGLSREIDTLSSVSFDVAYAIQENQDVDTSDITRTDFTATYSRSITQDVFASVGYRFRYRDDDGSATSNAVFFTVGRDFVTRF